jgi:hypothetical protein
VDGEQNSDAARLRANEVAQAALSGRMGMLEACRELGRRGHTRGVMSEEIHNVFVGADSETDHLPMGPVRELWDPQVLLEKDREIARMEAHWKDRVLAACKKLVDQQPRA